MTKTRNLVSNISPTKKRAQLQTLQIDADMWQERIRLAGDGTEAQKLLQGEYATWYKNQVALPQMEANKKMWDSIDKTAHDTFVSIFDGGKDAATRLRDTFKNVFFDWLYQQTIKKWIVNVQGEMTGGASGSGLSSLASNIPGGSAALAGIKSLVSQDAMPVMAMVASYMGAKAIANGYKVEGIGTALNYFGLAGGVVNRLFGMRAKEAGATTLNGSFTGTGFNGTNDTAWTQKGGLFRSDKSGVDKVAVDAAVSASLAATYDSIKAATNRVRGRAGPKCRQHCHARPVDQRRHRQGRSGERKSHRGILYGGIRHYRGRAAAGGLQV